MNFSCKHDIRKNKREYLSTGLAGVDIFMCECGTLLKVDINSDEFVVMSGTDVIDLFRSIRHHEANFYNMWDGNN
jgi:hypothetical protein